MGWGGRNCVDNEVFSCGDVSDASVIIDLMVVLSHWMLRPS